jgi:predicted signal transduction protein with EAL and GGDEF domain
VKSVNDRMGHHFGDLVIQQAANRISDALPPGAVAGRMGGDEFLVLADARYESLAEDLRSALSGDYDLNDVRFTVTASVGVARYDDISVEELSRRADLAMLSSKAAGKNRVTVYVPNTDARHQRSEQIARLLPLALKNGEFRTVVQPIVSLETGRLLHGECLARWSSPELGDIGPDEFVPVAEQSGDIALLDRRILNAALDVLTTLDAERARPVRLAVNVSAKDASLTNLDQDIARALSTHGIAPDRLIVELTESVFINRSSSAHDQLARLRAHGVALSLDDFGTGYSSLSYLQRVDFDFIKLDRSIIAALPSPRTEAIIASVVALARSLDAHLIAEGVETTGQRDRLIQLGCTLGQGFLFARPLEVDAWKALVRAESNAR